MQSNLGVRGWPAFVLLPRPCDWGEQRSFVTSAHATATQLNNGTAVQVTACDVLSMMKGNALQKFDTYYKSIKLSALVTRRLHLRGTRLLEDAATIQMTSLCLSHNGRPLAPKLRRSGF